MPIVILPDSASETSPLKQAASLKVHIRASRFTPLMTRIGSEITYNIRPDATCPPHAPLDQLIVGLHVATSGNARW